MNPETDPADQGGGRAPAQRGEELVRVLNTLAFPASADEVRDYARQRNVPDEMMEALEGLSQQRYTSLPDVVHEVYGEDRPGATFRDRFGRPPP